MTRRASIPRTTAERACVIYWLLGVALGALWGLAAGCWLWGVP